MPTSERRGPERSEFRDPESGRTIARLTNSQQEDKHTYYDICPWSADQKYILFSSTAPETLNVPRGDLWTSNQGTLYVMDTQTWAIQQIAENTHFNTHTGTFSVWHPTKHIVYTTMTPDSVGVVDVDARKVVRTMDGSLRQLSPDGQKIAWPVNEPGVRQGRGIYTMNEDGSDAHRIVSNEELYALLPNKNEFPLEEMTVGNTKWTPDSRYMLVTEWTWGLPKLRRSLFVVSRDGTEKRWLCYFGHHHSWTPDGKQVLYCGWKQYESDGTRKDPRLFLVNFDGTNNHPVIEEPLNGHPIMDPSSRMIVTWDDRSIVLVHVAEQKVERLATLLPAFDQSHKGTHPHPTWSPDGKQILYNSAQTGHSQVYLITL